jgi:hypothetical protein
VPVRILGISLALVNLLLWFCVPAIRAFVDETTSRWSNTDNPRIGMGVQELLVYFDPWLAGVVFPLIYIFGLAAIPFLMQRSPAGTGPRPGLVRTVIVSLLLIAFELVWLLLIAVGVFLRGPNWNIFWPGEPWDESKVVPLNNVNLSDAVWLGSGGRTVDSMPWVVRELPGLALVGGYLLTGMVIAYWLYRSGSRATSYWRWAVAVLLFQLASLVPLKMMCRWLFSTKYWIYIPEHGWNV